MSPNLSPFVYWAQSESGISLKVDLKDVENPNVALGDHNVKFSGKGVGAKGLNEYQFSIDFYSDIHPDKSSYKIQPSKVDINLVKEKKAWWPRLTSTPQKPIWLKVDFDRWQSEEDLGDESEVRDVRDDYPHIYDQLQKEERGYRKEDLKKVYLICYNFFMYLGFLYVCSVLGVRFMRHGVDSFFGTYDALGQVMCYLHLLMLLEVVHPLIGYTKGSALMAFLQVAGRVVLLFALLKPEPRMQNKPVVFYLFLVWSAVEVVRYPYYITQLYNREIKFLTWLRYTVWIPLYPLGFLCEAFIMLKSIPYLEETGVYSMALPNSYNFVFHFPTALRIYLPIFMFPGVYVMMSYMYKARKSKLAGDKKKKTKSS